MVWGLFPVDPLPGEDTYYFFTKGTYKVGRKGCDIIVNKDKGVSRVHSEIIIDAMISMDTTTSTKKKSSQVRIKDCSKYGTFVKKPLDASKEKVHEFPNKETTLDDEDLISFGTGIASYRFSFIPLAFFVSGLDPALSKQLQDKISSIGASMTKKWSSKCTHILLDDNASLNADLVDAVVSKRHFVSYKWVEMLADKRIGTEIPSCSLHAPALMLQGVSVKIAVPESRENCLSGYTFLLDSFDKYKVKKKLQPLLEAFGAKVVPVREFIPHSQDVEDDVNNQIVQVISVGDGDGDASDYSRNLASLPKVSEINLVCATLSGHLDPAIFVSPPVLVASSCSTDETVVADSEPEVEITSVHTSSAIRKIESVDEKEIISIHSVESVELDNVAETIVSSINPSKFDDHKNTTADDIVAKSKGDQFTHLLKRDEGISTRVCKTDDAEIGTSDVIFSQDLIIRDTNLPPFTPSPTNNQVLNFKRFKKMATESGNGFFNLVPFSKHPYKGSEYDNDEIAESLKEEKKRKQREAVSDDLFNNAKAKKRGAVGFVQGLFKKR